MMYLKLEVVAAISEILGDMNLSGTVLTADIFSYSCGLWTSWWLLWSNIARLLESVDDALKFQNFQYYTRSNFEKLAKFSSNNRGALHLGVF